MIAGELSRQFELSTAWTFSRKGGGLIDEYIVEYEDYVGIGSGSFSYLDGTLLVNTFSLKQYRQRIASQPGALIRAAPLQHARNNVVPPDDGSFQPETG